MNAPPDVADGRAEDEALEWLVDFENLDDEERHRFDEWLNERPENSAAFARVEREWRRLDAVRRLADRAPEPDPDVVGKWLRRRRRRRYLPLAAAAMGAVAAVTLIVLLPADFEAEYSTAVGQYREIPLPDESVVRLNTDTQVAVSFRRAERLVRLLQGEAHFHVAPDPGRPFSVMAGSATVRAVGTAFNVYLKGEAVEVTVTDGVVEVVPNAPAKTPSAPQRPAKLRHGETVEYHTTIEPVSPVDPREVARQLAWQDGMLDFRGETLARVIAEASRYTTTRITIEDPAIEDLHVTGYFRAGDVETLLRLIGSNERVAVHRDGTGEVHLTARDGGTSPYRQ